MVWHIIIDAPRSAPYNMAKDEYCLRHALKTGQPILRLYEWEPFVLSVGRNQKIDKNIDLEQCQRANIKIIRRITGGRAVLHGNDLTYSVSAPISKAGFGKGIIPVYREISKVFQSFFQELGCSPEVKPYSGRERAEMSSPVCFSTPAAFEILIGGKKLVGSAQRLLPDGFLQHGSIPLAPQHSILEKVFTGVSPQDIQAEMTDLETLGVWRKYERETVWRYLMEAFEKVFRIRLNPFPWQESDEKEVTKLMDAYPLLDSQQEKPL